LCEKACGDWILVGTITWEKNDYNYTTLSLIVLKIGIRYLKGANTAFKDYKQ